MARSKKCCEDCEVREFVRSMVICSLFIGIGMLVIIIALPLALQNVHMFGTVFGTAAMASWYISAAFTALTLFVLVKVFTSKV